MAEIIEKTSFASEEAGPGHCPASRLFGWKAKNSRNMCKFFYLTKRCQKTKTKTGKCKKIKLNFGAKLASTLLIVLIIIFGSVYIVQINNLSTKGYQIKELENKISDLLEINKELEDKILTSQSIAKVNERIQNLELVNIGQAEYLLPIKDHVAAVAGY